MSFAYYARIVIQLKMHSIKSLLLGENVITIW